MIVLSAICLSSAAAMSHFTLSPRGGRYPREMIKAEGDALVSFGFLLFIAG